LIDFLAFLVQKLWPKKLDKIQPLKDSWVF